jgi:hypothetical protein
MTDTMFQVESAEEPTEANHPSIDLAPLSAPTIMAPGGIPGGTLPQGVHPLDQSVPAVPGGALLEHDQPPSAVGPLGPQSARRQKPWATVNEDALPVNQRSAHDWTANAYTLNATAGEAFSPIQLGGRLRGCVSTVVWVPTTSTNGVIISPDQGDIQLGAGITLNPGDSIEIVSEAPVWGGVIPGNAKGGPVQVVRTYNPPGGGLGLSSS